MRKLRRKFGLGVLVGLGGVAAVLALVAACQPVKVLNSLTPRGEFDVQKDVAYGDHPRQVMDIYTPSGGATQVPVVVFVHGGTWETGDKSEYLFVGQAFAELGYVTMVPNYRLYPEVEFPAFVDDIAHAVAAFSALPGGNTCADYRQVIVVGHSSGAHSAAMVVTDEQYLDAAGADLELQAFIGLAGPYDLPLDDPQVVDKFPGVDDDQANPYRLVTAAAPPSLLLHGADDDIVEPRHSQKMADRLRELDVPVTLKLYDGAGHADLVASLAKLLRFRNPAYQDIVDFLQEQALSESCSVQ